MPSFWNSALGVHEPALHLYGQRANVLSANLANSDTPNYKARDVDFKETLSRQVAGKGAALTTTSGRHIQPQGYVSGGELMYRVPVQPSLDGNTVESHIEKSEFLENAVRYQASLQFLSSKFKGLKSAIRGE